MASPDETPAEATEPSEAPPAPPAYRPPFARGYPSDPDLDRLLAAFVDGDYARVREEAPALASRAADPAVARAALDLRKRLDVDPLSLAMLGGMASLLLFLVLWFYSHRHGH